MAAVRDGSLNHLLHRARTLSGNRLSQVWLKEYFVVWHPSSRADSVLGSKRLGNWLSGEPTTGRAPEAAAGEETRPYNPPA